MFFFFFFQAEDGIRDKLVTGVQTCALPISDRLGQVAPDLALVDVERGRELDVADVVGPEARVHQAGDELAVRGVLVVLDALDEGRRAIADADDGDSNGSHGLLLTDVRSRA